MFGREPKKPAAGQNIKIQDVIKELSFVAAELSSIKMEMVTDKITESEAKKKCSDLLKRTGTVEILTNAIEKWSK